MKIWITGFGFGSFPVLFWRFFPHVLCLASHVVLFPPVLIVCSAPISSTCASSCHQCMWSRLDLLDWVWLNSLNFTLFFFISDFSKGDVGLSVTDPLFGCHLPHINLYREHLRYKKSPLISSCLVSSLPPSAVIYFLRPSLIHTRRRLESNKQWTLTLNLTKPRP